MEATKLIFLLLFPPLFVFAAGLVVGVLARFCAAHDDRIWSAPLFVAAIVFLFSVAGLAVAFYGAVAGVWVIQ